MASVSAGFTLIELAMVALVLGLVLAIGAMGFGRHTDQMALRGATEIIAERLHLTRDRAKTTRTARTMIFQAGYLGSDYRVEIDGIIQHSWTLPNRISYAWLTGTINSVTMTPDGRCSTSGLVILEDSRGVRDTVGILSSGLILTK